MFNYGFVGHIYIQYSMWNWTLYFWLLKCNSGKLWFINAKFIFCRCKTNTLRLNSCTHLTDFSFHLFFFFFAFFGGIIRHSTNWFILTFKMTVIVSRIIHSGSVTMPILFIKNYFHIQWIHSFGQFMLHASIPDIRCTVYSWIQWCSSVNFIHFELKVPFCLSFWQFGGILFGTCPSYPLGMFSSPMHSGYFPFSFFAMWYVVHCLNIYCSEIAVKIQKLNKFWAINTFEWTKTSNKFHNAVSRN